MNELFTSGIIIGTLLILGIATLLLVNKIFSDKKRSRAVEQFKSYISVLEYHLEKAYEIVHRDNILIYSLEAIKMPDKEFNQITTDFVKLVERLIGPMLLEELIFLYGGEDAFVFNLTQYFSSRYEDDEIRQTAIDNLMESDIEET